MNKTFRRKIRRVFLLAFMIIVALLAVVRMLFPAVAVQMGLTVADDSARRDSIIAVRQLVDSRPAQQRVPDSIGGRAHRPIGVGDYKECFPDSQAVQLASAKLHGVKPVANREDAEKRKDELVFIGGCPYYELRDLTLSVPYLVPSAALLLQDIGRNFLDSVYVKQLPPCKPYVTSVTRTKEDVSKLQRYNRNATTQSCHLFGTTFDISYARYFREGQVDTWDDRYRRVLSEVLEDLREQKRCWVKYERLQPVFHITVR